MNQMPSFRPYIIPSIVMAVGGWGSLYFITNYALPTLWPRWGFFALIVVALTGTALPIVWFLNRQFSSVPPSEPHVIVRQSIWVGVYGAVLAWLQLGRVLTFMIGVWLAIGLVVIEYLVRLRERAQQRPVAKPFTRNDSQQ
jgi:hypothetical protein